MGKPEGQSFQFFAIVSQYKEPVKHKSQVSEQSTSSGKTTVTVNSPNPIVGLGVEALDGYPLGYPFDKPMAEPMHHVPNVHFHEVFVYHKTEDEIHNPTRDTVYRGTEDETHPARSI